ncbi:non-ribosomal peptide synthetase, partial [Pyxidicoccus trucidator]|uniref:non-ribosomal peptide synthetase n=1 Tax=Pyxidicoccus trucidator TaxID=2709662 RepID=UPI0013DC2DC2
WQRSWLQGEALENQLAWWREHLKGAPQALELPTDFARPPLQTFHGAAAPIRLSRPLSDALRSFCQKQGVTPFIVLLAAFQSLMSRYSGQDDVVVGSPTAGRRFAELEGLIGFFVNTLALRSRLDDQPSLTQLVVRVREATLGAQSHQDIPFEKLVEALAPGRALDRTPLFQVFFTLQNTPAGSAENTDLRITPFGEGTSVARFDLELSMGESPEGFAGTFQYNTRLFLPRTAERMASHLATLLEGALANPLLPLSAIPLLEAREREQLLVGWNDTARSFEAAPLQLQFVAQAARTPDALALSSGDEQLTYRQLHQRVVRLSRRLQALGVRPDMPVGLCAVRSCDMVAGLLAILHAGGAYLPLDPSYPAERLAYMLRDSGASVLLTHQALLGTVPGEGLAVLCFEEVEPTEHSGQPAESQPEHLAYVIYTSGSTGLPKGVMVPHRTAANFLSSMDGLLEASSGGTWLAVTSISFDIHVLELLWTLSRGLHVVLHDEHAASRGKQALSLPEVLRRHAVTHLQCTPSFARTLVLAPESVSALASLRHLLVGGEALPGTLARSLRAALPHTALTNMYGPTETTVWSSTHRVKDSDAVATVSLGTPIANTRLYVLDTRGQPVPVGVPGELFISGEGVVRGYLRRPDLTAERFIPDPFSSTPGGRMYRTGDLARWRHDGTLDFLGRADFQVKVRGFRIELGEVEAALSRHPEVLQAVAGVHRDSNGDGRLVAWLVPQAGRTLDASALRDWARHQLPEHLVPSLFVSLDAFPLTPNGKVDRKALPAPTQALLSSGLSYVEPRTPLEQQLAELYASVLGVPRVGALDDFFALGGHSLLATQAVSRIRAAFGVDVPLRALFEAPTVAALAAHIQAAPRIGDSLAVPPLRRASRDSALPLSFTQQRLWFLDQLQPGSSAYHMPFLVRLEGDLDVSLLQRSLTELVRRHESLRTNFRAGSDGPPVQVIHPPASFLLPIVDVSGHETPEEEARRQLFTERFQPFDLAQGPLFQGVLMRLGARDHVLMLTMHHIISDLWSVGVLVRELSALFQAFTAGQPSPLPEPTLQYADFAAWQREWLQGETLDAQLEWWQQQLDGAPDLELPTDFPRPKTPRSPGGHAALKLGPELSAALTELCRREGATPFMALLAAFQLVLGRYSGQDDIVVGSPIAGRNQAELEGLVGFFLNTLVLRTRLDGNPTLRELLGRVRGVALDAYAHQYVPFEHLRPLQTDGAQLFRVMFMLQNVARMDLDLPGLALRPVEPPVNAAKFDLTLAIDEGASGFTGQLEYSTELFEPATAERLLAHLQHAIATLVARPELRLSQVSLLDDEERHRLLVEWSGARADFPDDTTVDALIREQAQLAPEALAAVVDGQRLTYAELEHRANQLARWLRREGVGPDSIVGVCVERSLELVVALVGIQHAGGAYLPLDPSLPRERLAFMLEDSGARALVTQQPLLGRFSRPPARVLLLDAQRSELEAESGAPMHSGATSRNTAYVIYTSGSTGQPKGVLVEHRGVCNLVTHEARAYEVGPGTRMLQFANLGFDISVEEVFTTLCAGGTLYLAPLERLMPGEPLHRFLREQAITAVSLTPAALAATESSGLPALRTVISGGEACSADIVERWGRGRRFLNTYGPTEGTVVATLTACAPDGRAPSIGQPLANVRTYVLDASLQPVPVGVPGELYLGGVGVARGYLGRPSLTAERFVPSPFAHESGARLYRTGDRVKWRANGELDFLGRVDTQVKVRGFRIELGEVESALAAHPAVRGAVVVVREDGPLGRRLVGYAVPAPGQVVEVETLRRFLKERLPEYMVPASLVRLDALPLTPNGKVDHKALPAPDASAEARRDFVAPRTATEQALAELWSRLLGVTQIGVHDGFFELGGQSVIATQAIARLRNLFGIDLPLRVLFEAPTLEGLARKVDAALASGQGSGLPAPSVAPRNGAPPLSFAQQRLWFLDQLQPGSTAYHMPFLVRLEGDLDVSLLQRSLTELVRRHESLRTNFRAGADGPPVQLIHPPAPFLLPLVDLAGHETPEEEAKRQLAAAHERPFDLADGPLFRGLLLRLGATDHVLMLTMHHIISDLWSVGVLARELSTLFQAFSAGQPSPLPEPTLQYADFAVWQREWLQGETLDTQLKWWQQQLAGAPDLELPTDFPRPKAPLHPGGHAALKLSPELSAALTELCRREGATPFMALLAAFQLVLGRYSGQDDIVVGSPIAGRNQAEFEGLVGFFLNTLVLRTRLDGDPSLRELLGRVRGVALDAYAHQHVPFESLRPMQTGGGSFFRVMFILQNVARVDLELPGLAVRPVEPPVNAAKFDMTLTVTESASGFTGQLEYSTELFEPATAERFLAHVQRAVATLVTRPELRLSQVSLLDDEERHRLLVEWSGARADFPDDTTVDAIIREQARLAPEALAAVVDGQRLTYAELEHRANQLASRLRREGVGPDSIVGVCVERSLELVVALVGILHAGGAYLPLDPSLPRERLAFMLEDSGARALVTQQPLLGRFSRPPVRVVLLDAQREELEAESGAPVHSGATARNTAYVIYTSGSTGQPKGVLVEHRSVCNLVTQEARAYEVGPGTRMLQFANLGFDISVEEVFTTLCAGGTLHLAPLERLMPGEPLHAFLREQAITAVSLTPAALAATESTGLPALRTVISGGEACSADIVERWGKGRRFLNTYGPTEGTVVATLTDCEPDGRAPSIGQPLANVRTYVLDASLQPVPVGVPGELYLGGVGVARGYLGRPALTAERFLPSPFEAESGARLYRTGDRVKWRANGELDFLGRVDTQVKVRGFRIELGEVESALAAHPAVRGAVVVVREDGPLGRRLVGYVVLREGAQADGASLRADLKESLPEYMVPSAVVVLSALPLTPNGKVDRRALPAPDFDIEVREHITPRTPTEERVAQLWSQLLGVQRVNASDNFFDLGGHSLLATQAVSRIRQAFGVELPLRGLFEAPTVEGLARLIDATLSGKDMPTTSRPRDTRALSLPVIPLEDFAASEQAKPSPVHPAGDSAVAPVPSEEERQRVLVEWNATATEYPHDSTLPEVFSRVVARFPNKVAVEFQSELGISKLTYRELDVRANQLAWHLRGLGVSTDSRVAVAVERSLELIVSLVAILKAGGAYVPLDAAYPRERLAAMLEDSRPLALVTTRALQAKLPAQGLASVVLEDAPLSGQPVTAPPSAALPGSLAYIDFTSGSTGRPKGVSTPHAAILRTVFGVDYAHFGPDETYLLLAPISFDASTLEVWGPLLHGARLAIFPPHSPSDVYELEAVLVKHGVTTLHLTAGLFSQMVDSHLPGLRTVKQLLTGGDVVSAPHVRRVLEELRIPVTACYGPTEGTLFTSCHRMTAVAHVGDSVPIGRPIGNTQVYVLDASGQPVPPGVIGELFIGGDGLARGYVEQPALTAERFVPNPFSSTPGARLYRTGDLARWRADGVLEFLGRADAQVKVRGYRIELGEVEAALLAFPGVREAVVVAHEDRPGDKRLVGYVAAPESLDVRALHAFVRQRLPEYMVPSVVGRLDALPLTVNGKVDRKALPAPSTFQPRVSTRAPRTERERELAALWARVLHVDAVGAEDDFFELGGHSLSATQVLSRIRAHYRVELSFTDFFTAPTVAALALRIEELSSTRPAPPQPLLQPRTERGPVALSFAQQRLWFFAQLEPDSAAYNLPFAVRLEGTLDVAAFSRGLRDVLQRHEALRTTFREHEHQPVQVISARPALPAGWVDLSAMPEAERESSLQRLVEHESLQPFDLRAGPLWRVVLVRLSEQEHALLITLHHVIADGWSMGVLFGELSKLYTAHATGQPARLEPLPVQYADYALWQRAWLRDEALEAQLGWWRQRLQGAPRALELPTDKPRPATQSFRGGEHRFHFPRELSEALDALCRQEGTTPSMVVLAAFQALLARYSGQDDISIGSPIAGRTHAELEGLIGFFVNTLVLRTRLEGGPSFRALLARVRDTTLGAYEHQDVPFEKLVEALRPEREPNRSPLFQVMLAYQNAPMPEVMGPGLRLNPLDVEQSSAKFDLTLSVFDGGNGLMGQLEYSTDLFEASTAARMVGHLRVLLEGVLAAPDRPLSAVSILTPEERHLLVHAWREPAAATAGDACLHRLFQAQARLAPDTVAVELEGQTLTWSELHSRARQVYRSLLARGLVALSGPPPLMPVPRTETPPVSFAQQRLWFLDQLKPGSAFYSIPMPLRLEGPLDVGALERAFTELVRRHESLRTTFHADAGHPFQRIHPPTPFHLSRVDLSA